MHNKYLYSLNIPTISMEESFLNDDFKNKLVGIYNSSYPFGVFEHNSPEAFLSFDSITILYGSNGSGKSTLLNLLAEKVKLERKAAYSKTDYFDDYCKLCSVRHGTIPTNSKIITSDDIFRRLSDIHILNASIDQNRDEIWNRLDDMRSELGRKPTVGRLHGLDDYNRFKEYQAARSQTTSRFLRERTQQNLKSRSNGETAMEYLIDQITDGGLYLLDEPENSLAPALQIEFKKYIEESARFFNCQFIIATHSPILLACECGKIYNLDKRPVNTCEWNELENIKVMGEFFSTHFRE